MSTGQALGGVVGAVAGFALSGGNPMGAVWAAQGEMMVENLIKPADQKTETQLKGICSEHPQRIRNT